MILCMDMYNKIDYSASVPACMALIMANLLNCMTLCIVS